MRNDALPDPRLGWQFSTVDKLRAEPPPLASFGAWMAVATKPMAPTIRPISRMITSYIMRQVNR
jgi:hypothetical protein